MAKKKTTITNAMRMLQKDKIDFDAIEYEIDGEIEEHFGEKVSQKTGIPMEQSFKTLVARDDKQRVIVCCIPVNKEVDLKKLAAESENKKVELIHVKELLELTGYVRGGVSPIGMKKKYPTYIDLSCLKYEKIAISGGVCGVTLMLNTGDILKVTGAKACMVTRD